MEPGQTGTVKAIDGGRGMAARLQALGLYPGQKLTMLSSVFLKGPVVVEINRSQVALGYGRACRIYVELKK
ncbi:MAG TPA: ferrous iron transport protein A [Firmicutes bacterium]|nr:ferrous iron transport protein A [Bacillota bacterium]